MLKTVVKAFVSCCLLPAILLLLSCSSKKKGAEQLAGSADELQQQTTNLIQQLSRSALTAGRQPGDSSLIFMNAGLVNTFYGQSQFTPRWCAADRWLPLADSLFSFIESSRLFGLFPSDYHDGPIRVIREKFRADSLAKNDRRNARLWAQADLLLTDAFFRIVRDLKLGRLPPDSISLRPDTVLRDEFYIAQWEQVQQTGINKLAESLEPAHRGYRELKAGIPSFLRTAAGKSYTAVPYPEKNNALFNRALQKRLVEAGYLPPDSILADSLALAGAIKKFQQDKGLAVDGRAGEATVRMMNVNDQEKFVRIAISMDKYKMLPPALPDRYIWVNAASNMLELVENGEVKLSSRVICGKSKTRTPVLSSAISELITYPQWVPPPSIVSKEILPAVKRNPGYLARKGFSLVDSKGNEVDPWSVDWAKYTKNIPFRVVQGSGDANALGIMKFVFSNKYSVYLHDTNQRYLFANAMRSLSHGCVRVQEWEKLAYYILAYDRGNTTGTDSRADSVKTWLQKKQKRSIALRNKIPVFIRYISCTGANGQITFHDDVYGEDKMLREKYFAGK